MTYNGGMRELPTCQSWRLLLCGQIVLLNAKGVPIPLPTRISYLALAVLANAPHRTVDRVTLARTLWPSSSLPAARSSLRNALAAIRKIAPGIIEVDGQAVTLSASVECDFLIDDPEGVFMPNFDHDWAIDIRLSLRAKQVDLLLCQARGSIAKEDWPMARLLAEKAARLDPLDQAAATLLVEVLSASGRHQTAWIEQSRYSSRMVREMGCLPSEGLELNPVQNPLIRTVEWLLSCDPQEALAMLAAIDQIWLTLPLDQVIGIHERALALCSRGASGFELVTARLAYLKVLAGTCCHLEVESCAVMQSKLEVEPRAAAQWAIALAYNNLSRGRFRRAKELVMQADSIQPSITNRQHVAIILEHIGEGDRSVAMHDALAVEVEEHGSPVQIASQLLLTVEPLVTRGQVEEGYRRWERSTRIFNVLGATRMTIWSQIALARIYEATGDFGQAQSTLAVAKDLGYEAGGQAAASMVSDRMARLECHLGAFDSAVRSLSYSAQLRRQKQAVPSIVERLHRRGTMAMLSDKVSLKGGSSANLSL